MRYSHAVRHSVLKKVLPPESRSIAEVSREFCIIGYSLFCAYRRRYRPHYSSPDNPQ